MNTLGKLQVCSSLYWENWRNGRVSIGWVASAEKAGLTERNYSSAERSSQICQGVGNLRQGTYGEDFKQFRIYLSPLKKTLLTCAPRQTAKFSQVIDAGCQKPFNSPLPPHFMFLLSATENILLPLCMLTVTSNELDGSWKHPHTFSNLSLQNTALFAVGPCGIQNKYLFFSARIFKMKKRTFKLYLQSHFTDSRPVSGRDKSELGKSGTCEFFSCTVFRKEKPSKCCFGCPVEPYFMNCQRLRAKDKLFLHEWVLLKYFKRKLNISVTVLLSVSLV